MSKYASFPASSTTTQIVIGQYGDAATLTTTETVLPPPAAGEIRVRHTAIGVNYVDIYHRTGLYPLPSLPAVLGVEAAGVVEALGPDVDTVQIGQRIAYAGPPTGSYAGARNLPAARAIPLPDDVTDDAVASLLLRGITTHMLLNDVRPLKAGETVLVHAAAGGLGLVIVQWAKTMGARVIGTVSSPAKAALATAHGLDHAIHYREEDFVAAVMRLTDGQGVDYAIDGIGGKTLLDTLGCVRPYGMVASVGQVAGDSGPLDLSLLGPARSVALIRPGVFRFMTDLARYREGARATIRQLQMGLRPSIGAVLPLNQAAEAHRRLESGATVGATLLQP
ncbi:MULTISPECIES: quinone oxidoreductase [unclassified Paludibacterium]|uniref:quinone oxidoreductase family protein n=1 Tax=unclassified Paludibacterium TaxID=2618429 RepID=UPI001C0539C6|nr:quinone oxidoreductase [Paludibacterium sp. B53371]BEV70705.1 quinone oxidoreductase [Paludibacterium sp. THUN1379]